MILKKKKNPFPISFAHRNVIKSGTAFLLQEKRSAFAESDWSLKSSRVLNHDRAPNLKNPCLNFATHIKVPDTILARFTDQSHLIGGSLVAGSPCLSIDGPEATVTQERGSERHSLLCVSGAMTAQICWDT